MSDQRTDEARELMHRVGTIAAEAITSFTEREVKFLRVVAQLAQVGLIGGSARDEGAALMQAFVAFYDASVKATNAGRQIRAKGTKS